MNLLIKISAALTLIACLSACKDSGKQTAGAGGDGKTNLEFWHYQSGPQGKVLDELLLAFEKENPQIRVRGVFQGNPNQLKQKLDGSFASGTGNNPAVSLVYESWTDDFLAQGYIDPLQNYLDGPDGLSKEEQGDFVKAFVEGNTWNGQLVTLPFNKSVYLLHMNTEKFQQAGYTTAPVTQGELVEALKKLTVKSNGRTATYGMGVIPKSEAFTTLLLARGGELVSDVGRPQFDSPKALEALQLLKSLQYPEKYLYVNTDYMSVPFGNSLIASFIYSSASLPYNRKAAEGKFNYSAAPIPGAEGAESRYLMQGTNIAIFKNKPDAERQAAWKLVKFLTSPKQAATFVTQSGYMPYRYSMLNEAALKEHMSQDPNYAMAAQLVLTDKGKQEPKMAAWEGIRSELDTMVDTLFARPDSDPAALLADIQKKAEARLKPR